jgi:hypothetical protein
MVKAKAKSTDDSAKGALFYCRTHRYKKTGRHREYGKSAHLHLTAFHAQSLTAQADSNNVSSYPALNSAYRKLPLAEPRLKKRDTAADNHGLYQPADSG